MRNGASKKIAQKHRNVLFKSCSRLKTNNFDKLLQRNEENGNRKIRTNTILITVIQTLDKI